MAEENKKSAANRYAELDKDRSTTLDRAELCSQMTIPYLFMEDGSSAQDDLDRNYVQGYGAKLVNGLVGKFALSILPPSQPFYRLSATEEAMSKITSGDVNAQFEVEKILSIKEEGILRYINKSKFRVSLYPALRMAMVTGDSLIEKVDDGVFRVLNMKNYVIKRDPAGRILEIVINEKLSYESVPTEIQATIKDEDKKEDIEMYTYVYLEEGKYKRYQEINDETVSGSKTQLKKLSDTYISLRWNEVDGEDYGRSFVEENLGTFISLEKQMKVINESAVISSKVVHTVNPNGMTKYEDFVKAKNGGVIIGNETDIGTVKSNKDSDLRTTLSLIQDYKRELSEAFLAASSSIRDAERVTKAEVQMVASELEAAFGGIYTSIAENIQIPLIENAMDALKIKGGKDVDIIITAGVEALGRNVEMSKINGLMQELTMLAGLVGPEAVAKTVSVAAITGAMVANSGVASKNFLLSQGQVDQIEIAEKEEVVAGKIMESGIQGAGQEAGKNLVKGEEA